MTDLFRASLDKGEKSLAHERAAQCEILVTLAWKCAHDKFVRLDHDADALRRGGGKFERLSIEGQHGLTASVRQFGPQAGPPAKTAGGGDRLQLHIVGATVRRIGEAIFGKIAVQSLEIRGQIAMIEKVMGLTQELAL